MLQTAFRSSFMNRAWVFEWHKRFKEGRESVRDDEKCGRSKKVRTPELIGQMKNFVAKDRRVSIETISAEFDLSVGTVHTIIREELKMRKISAKFVPSVFGEDQKERRCHDSREMIELMNSDLAVLDALVTCDESWIYCYDPETKRQSSQWKHADSPRPKKARQSKYTHKLLMIPFFVDRTDLIYMHWVPTGKTVNTEYYVEVLSEFGKRFPRKRPALFKSGQWHFHQDNAPVHNSILVTDYLTKMSIKTVAYPPYSPDLLPVTFGYSLSSEAVVMRQLRRWKRLWRMSLTRTRKRTSRSCWNGRTSALQPEEITPKGTSFMCVLSIKVAIRKKSGNLFNEPCIFIYICVCVCMCSWVIHYIYIYIYRRRSNNTRGSCCNKDLWW